MKNINIETFLESLTKKQLEVLCCLIFGLSYKSIGKLLEISDRTVGVHIHEILQKAGAPTKDEIIKLFNLPENIRYYEKLKNRYHLISGRIPQKHSLFLRVKYIVLCSSMALLLGATLYYYLNRAEISLQSIENSSYLLERNNLIEQMRPNSGIIILKGQGGAGKTTLAREYLKNIAASVKYEINTETKTSFKSELSGLARVLSKNPKELENKSILDSITDEHERLRHLSIFLFNLLKKEKSWCLLLDNLDNLSLISLMYLDNFLQLQNGTIVITTRNKDVDSYFPKAKVISIEKLSEKEKQKLFYKITKLPSSKIIEENLQKIPSYPLDVSCCAYYIKNTGISLPAYIQQMEKMDYVFWKGNQKILTENANYDKSRYNIVISSIENILQQNTAITETLFAVSVFDSQKIPVSLLTKIIGEQLYYESIHNFRKYGLLEINNDNTIALHRTAQLILRHYCFQNVSQTNLLKFATKICDAILSEKEKEELIPHVKAILNNLKDILPLSYKTEMRKFLIKLIQNYGCPAIGAVKYIREITQTKNATLSQKEIADLRLEGARLCILGGRNEEAFEFLNMNIKKLDLKQENLQTYINYYMLCGILNMRSRKYKESDDCFNKALELANKIVQDPDYNKIIKAKLYSEKGLNYFLFYLNKPQMRQAIQIMKHTIDLISDSQSQEAISILANTKIWLASIYNSLKEYDNALKMCEETEKLLKQIETKNNNYYYLQGSIYVEKGHNALRSSKLDEAKYYLGKAKKIFNKLAMYDHFYRVRMQETETLVRLKNYSEAYQNCLEVIKEGKTDNNFNELFLNTAYYNAGTIQYKLHQYPLALKHFRDFTIGMKKFCRHFLNQEKYEELERLKVFNLVYDKKDFKICFYNALEIFKKVCVSGSEFVTDYVQKNFEECE